MLLFEKADGIAAVDLLFMRNLCFTRIDRDFASVYAVGKRWAVDLHDDPVDARFGQAGGREEDAWTGRSLGGKGVTLPILFLEMQAQAPFGDRFEVAKPGDVYRPRLAGRSRHHGPILEKELGLVCPDGHRYAAVLVLFVGRRHATPTAGQAEEQHGNEPE